MLDVIAFDADDTLWHTEHLFSLTQAKFAQLLSKYHNSEQIEARLLDIEMRNLQYFGYGIKGFTLSMIETAIELSEGQVGGRDIQTIIDFAREMLATPVQLLDHVQDTIAKLAASQRLMVITKGDLIDQESKIAQSGLADYFAHIEIVSDKTRKIYETCLAKYNIAPQRFLMIGNSLKSDVLPVVELGAYAVYIPYHTTWAHERVDASDLQADYFELEHIGLLPPLIEKLNHVMESR
jgi:putative hydrolase of the HAD superfamily